MVSAPLPGTPGPALQALWEALTAQERDAFLPHLIGNTASEWLAQILAAHGHKIGATTIKSYRRSLRQNGTTQ